MGDRTGLTEKHGAGRFTDCCRDWKTGRAVPGGLDRRRETRSGTWAPVRAAGPGAEDGPPRTGCGAGRRWAHSARVHPRRPFLYQPALPPPRAGSGLTSYVGLHCEVRARGTPPCSQPLLPRGQLDRAVHVVCRTTTSTVRSPGGLKPLCGRGVWTFSLQRPALSRDGADPGGSPLARKADSVSLLP